jgi:hypothetical protein
VTQSSAIIFLISFGMLLFILFGDELKKWKQTAQRRGLRTVWEQRGRSTARGRL